MDKCLDFSKVKKTYLSIKLLDGTEIKLTTPKKALFDELSTFYSTFEKLEENLSDMKVIDELYEISAKVMSCNKEGIEISTAQLENELDLEDIILFFNAYYDFVQALNNAKN